MVLLFEFSLAYDALFSTMIENSLRILQIQNHFRTKGGLDLLKKKNVHKGERIVMSNTQNHSVLYTVLKLLNIFNYFILLAVEKTSGEGG